MEKEFDSNIIKNTQSSLGKYVKRPPLSEKLLKKPPFRFLHDIVTSVSKSTGFFDGLFEEHELTSDNVKDREAKIIFLNKIIFVISKTIGKELSVKASKIVAGQEPEKTNELLQCLAEALDKNLSPKEAIITFQDASVKNISKEPKTNIKSSSKQNEKSKKYTKNISTSNRLSLQEKIVKQKQVKSPIKNISLKSKVKPNDIKENNKQDFVLVKDLNEHNDIIVPTIENIQENFSINETLPDANSHDDSLNITRDINSSNDLIENFSGEHIDNQEVEKNLKQSKIIQSKDFELTKKTPETTSTEKYGEQKKLQSDLHETVEKTELPDSITDGSEKCRIVEKLTPTSNMTVQHVEKIVSTARLSSVRPLSSRPGAPRIRDKQDYNNIPSANNIAIGKVNIILENALLEEEEESTFVIENNTEDVSSQQQQDYNEVNQHGRLVQQILKSQKAFTQIRGKSEIDWVGESQKSRDDLNKEIEQLRFNVQALSRVANPLGKILDHVQEDVEVMRQELLQWLQIYEETMENLLKQKAINEELISPLCAKIKQLDIDTLEKQQKLNNLKIIIYKNITKIEKLLPIENVQ